MPAATSASPAAPAVELDFGVRGAAPVEHAAAPAIRFDLAVTSRGGVPVRSVVLDVQIQIAARRRSYSEREQARLADLFGAPARWADTLRSVPWLRITQVVPAFAGETVVGLQVPCTYDFDVAGSKYFAALADGDVPLELLFGGTIFYTGAGGALQTGMIGWDKEAGYRLPVGVWRATMDRYFPHSAWLRVDRDTFDRLYAYRARHALPSWEQALDRLLGPEEEG